MVFQYSEIENGIRLITLSGKLDISGVSAIETEFSTHCSGETPRVIVDLSAVDFLASIGIRLLTLNAKSIASRGGRMVLLNPKSDIKDVLEITGIPAIIPLYHNLKSAEAALASSGDERHGFSALHPVTGGHMRRVNH
jgi:anti-sigma B factor antagonist